MHIVEKPIERITEHVIERTIEKPAAPPLQGFRESTERPNLYVLPGRSEPTTQPEVQVVYVPVPQPVAPPAQPEAKTAARPEVQPSDVPTAQPAQPEVKTEGYSKQPKVNSTRKGEENNSDQRTKTIRTEEEKNSENNSGKNSLRIVPELFAPDKPASQAPANSYKKKGKVGRKRKYEEPGTNGEIPVKEVVLFRQEMGRHWPGMSEDMKKWYDFYYFTRPNKGKDKSKYEQHLRSYERGRKWISEADEEE